MKKIVGRLITAGLAGFLMVAAAEAFDAKKFFEELGDRGGSVPSNFDGNVFLDDLKDKGMTSENRIGPNAFFAELQSRGVRLPSNFNGKAFLDDCKQKGIGMPEMVDMKK
jgi:hypothetical protein